MQEHLGHVDRKCAGSRTVGLAELQGVQRVVSLENATAGIRMLMRKLKLKRKRKVICSLEKATLYSHTRMNLQLGS